MSKINPIHNAIDIAICADAADALNKGFDYTGTDKTGTKDAFNPIKIEKVVIVKNGTVEGHSTVDFILEDKDGNKHVFMITGRLLGVVTSSANN